MAVTTRTAPERLRLAILPTPLTEGPRLAAGLGLNGRVLVKRDDLTGFAVAGNKARPLELLTADAVAHDADALVTGGSPGSNFCTAAAAAARYLGIRCELVLSGCEDAPTAGHPNVQAARRWGADVRYTDESDRRSVDTALERRAAQLRTGGNHPYVIPRGGATPLGSVGYHLAAQELADQLDGPALVVVATGSGGTLAGLVAGAVEIRAPWRIVGASVSRPPSEITGRVRDLANGCARLMRTRPPQGPEVRVHDARGPGHATPSDEGAQASAIALRTEGLVLDPVYTAKALGAVPAIHAALADPDLTTVFWHTGGLLDAVAEWSDDDPR